MFENIFSSKKPEAKKENKEKQSQIIIDIREKQSLVVANLIEQKANIKFELLKIADYIIEGKETIAIERKTYSDFISSIINKRLFQQLQEIKKYPSYFIIIEGRNEIENKNLEKAAGGMILSIITEYKIPIIFTKNPEETAEYLILLAKRQLKPKQEIGLRHCPSNLTKEEQKQFILEGFPSIGPKTAKKLLKEFKTIKNIIDALSQNNPEIIKILGKKFEIIKNLLD